MKKPTGSTTECGAVRFSRSGFSPLAAGPVTLPWGSAALHPTALNTEGDCKDRGFYSGYCRSSRDHNSTLASSTIREVIQ